MPSSDIDNLKALEALLSQAYGAQLVEFKRRLGGLRRRLRNKQEITKGLTRLAVDLEKSVMRRQQRIENLPKPEFDSALPVSGQREKIAESIAQHQVVIIAGETGSGKTTQIPKICLALGRGVNGYIGCTQPRRIAARSVATRVAEELNSEPGDLVGWKVRFNEVASADSYIKFMTDGILLAEAHGGGRQGKHYGRGDRFLNQYDTLIIDEAHERSLNIDFLLGYLKQILPKRPDLKLIITSATIDTQRFSKHFDDAPVIEVSGRTFPVETRYRPLLDRGEDQQTQDMEGAILEAVDELAREHQTGDILVFLPGEREIRDTADALNKHRPEHTEILPLYARLTAAEQNRVFRPHKGRRIVLATNVAETSLTVPGIRYVIDPGLARVSRYSPNSKVQRLPIEKISQASANQRKGRCGRVAEGICIRLYSEEDFNNRAEFTDPEIKRSSLAGVVLRMQDLDLGAVESFPFVEPPQPKQINDGYKLLEELGAVDSNRRLTDTGRRIAKLPVDPKLARMILAANDSGCLREVLIIASALSIPDPRLRPSDKRQAADQKHAQWKNEQSDFLSFVALWDAMIEQSKSLSNSKFRRWCKDHWLGYMRVREWRDLHTQLLAAVKQHKMKLNAQVALDEANYAGIHMALLSGLLGNVGLKDEQDYIGARNIRFAVFPTSGLRKKKPRWLMSAQLLDTSRLYAHTVAKIEPQWLETVAQPLLKRSYSEPHWEKRPAQVAAFEKVTLYGLPVIAKRRANFGPVDPVASREIFIREALVQGEYHTRAAFFAHNRNLVVEIEDLEARARRRDLLADEASLYDFYDGLIPQGIYSGKSFDRWRKKAERTNPKCLFISREQLLQRDTTHVSSDQYPDHIVFQGLSLAVEYHFDPGHAVDGINVLVPLSALNLLNTERFEWLVPGLLREKLVQLIRSLPKSLRKNFVPVPDYADALMDALEWNQGNLFDAVAHHLQRMTGVALSRSDWTPDAIDDHLQINYKVLNEDQAVIEMGRDLVGLQESLEAKARESFTALPKFGIEREAMTAWDLDELPETIEVEQGGVVLHGYPALVVQKQGVAVKVLDSQNQANRLHNVGLRALFKLQLAQKLKYLRRNTGLTTSACLHYAPAGKCKDLETDMIDAVFDRAFGIHSDPIRDRQTYEQRLEEGTAKLLLVATDLGKQVSDILLAYHSLRKVLNGNLSPAMLEASKEVKEQLGELIYGGFISVAPEIWLRRYPMYLKAMAQRLDKAKADPLRDRKLSLEVKPFWNKIEEDPALKGSDFRWMVEEFRVSLFAQGLRTAKPVSAKRLQAMLKG